MAEAIQATIGAHDFRQFAEPVQDATGLALRQLPFGICFRGQSDATWDVEPAVFRGLKRGGAEAQPYDETSIYWHGQLRVPDEQRGTGTCFDWLAHMQHYGVPTRLLDWTESLLVALYFAAEGPDASTDAALFALNGYALNHRSRVIKHGVATPNSLDVIMRAQMSLSRDVDRWAGDLHEMSGENLGDPGEFERLIRPQLRRRRDVRGLATACSTPVVVFPRRVNSRMTFQAAMFTIHGGKRYALLPQSTERLPRPVGLWELQKDKRQKDTGFLRWWVIPGAAKGRIAEELLWLGTHSGTLFPELDKQAVYLKDQWAARRSKPNRSSLPLLPSARPAAHRRSKRR